MRTLLLAFLLTLVAGAIVLLSTPPATDKLMPTPPHAGSVSVGVLDVATLAHCVGYEGLDSGMREVDRQRLADVIGAHGIVNAWPMRDHYEPTSLKKFPVSVDLRASSTEPVPVYLIVDPDAIDKAWGAASPENGPSNRQSTKSYWDPKHPALDESDAAVSVWYIEPTVFRNDMANYSRPYPSWADAVVVDGVFPKIANAHRSVVSSTLLGSANILGPSLASLGVKSVATFEIYAVSASTWRVVHQRPKSIYDKQIPRGELAFPLWESGGLQRDAEDPWVNERASPMSSHVESPEFEWRIAERSSFVLPAPIPWTPWTPAREYVVLPETLAKQPVPIISVYKAKTWKPFAEDFVFRIGPPTTAEGLRAVCVFMTCTDEQLKSVADAMSALVPKPAEPPIPAQPPAGKP